MRIGWMAFGVLALPVLVGCSGEPFQIAPVHGKVAFRDGSPIQADHIVVSFIPQGIAAIGNQAPKVASGDVNPTDGTFPGLTTHKHLDGAIVGRHKVIVTTLKKAANGLERPIPAVPNKYCRQETTPLDIEVPKGGGEFTLLLDK
jgi:hypothetical protein